MRLGVLAAIILVGLSGCSAPDEATAATLTGWTATYDLEYVIEDREGPTVFEGWLALDFGGPRIIADRDLTLRQAYQLTVTGETWPQTDPTSRQDMAKRIHHIDAGLHVVRTDLVCVPEAYCFGERTVDWGSQGAPAPFGVFWPDALRYQVDGRWTDVVLQEDGSRRHLPEHSLLPLAWDQEPNLWFERSSQAFPSAFGWVNLKDPAQAYSVTTTMTATLREFERGNELAPADAWPLREWAQATNREFILMGGETDEAFNMGVTYLESWEGLFNSSADAQKARASQCAQGAMFMWGGGARAPVAGLWDFDDLYIFATGYSTHASTMWSTEYSDGSTLDLVLGAPGYRDTEFKGAYGTTFQCPLRASGAAMTANDALRTSWAYELAGDPCDLEAKPGFFVQTGRPGVTLSGSRFTSFLWITDEENRPWGKRFPVGRIAYNAEDGLLDSFAATGEDLERLETGRLGDRPWPREPWAPVREGGFRCVPPEYEEGPLTWLANARPTTAPWPQPRSTSPSPASPLHGSWQLRP